jgi:hypothetical protein
MTMARSTWAIAWRPGGIAKRWAIRDDLGMLRQLGALAG